MTALPRELRVKRKLMAEYIRRDHVEIVLKRPNLIRSAAGGLIQDPNNPFTTLDPQKFKFYPFIRRMTKNTMDTPDGEIQNVRYVIVGLYTADVKMGDRFIMDGGQYEVVSLDPHVEDRIAANVTYHGKADDVSYG
jgi:hypothetical protein